MKYVTLILLLIMIFLVKNSSLSLLIYGFFAADRDGYAFLEFLSISYTDFKLYSRIIFLLLFVYSIFFLFLVIKKLTLIEAIKIFSVLVVSFLIVFNSLIKDGDVIWAVSLLVFSGIPVYLIWYVMGLKYNNDNNFIVYIVIKTMVATLVLLIPSLIFLDGSLYKSEEGIFVNDVADVNLAVPTGESIKGAYSRYSIYHNPNSLGFHSVIALLVGIYLYWDAKRNWKKFLAFILIIAGLIGWLNSLTRGPMIFLILGFIYIAVLNMVSGGKEKFEIKIFFAIITIVVGMIIFVVSDVSEYLIPDSNDISVVERLQGYIYSFEVIKNHLLFGVDKSWDWGRYYPHFIPLSLTADHGVIVGLWGSLLIFGGGIMTIYTASKKYLIDALNRKYYFLSILLVFLVFGIAITNNFTAPVVFWIMLAQADILNKRIKYD